MGPDACDAGIMATDVDRLQGWAVEIDAGDLILVVGDRRVVVQFVVKMAGRETPLSSA